MTIEVANGISCESSFLFHAFHVQTMFVTTRTRKRIGSWTTSWSRIDLWTLDWRPSDFDVKRTETSRLFKPMFQWPSYCLSARNLFAMLCNIGTGPWRRFTFGSLLFPIPMEWLPAVFRRPTGARPLEFCQYSNGQFPAHQPFSCTVLANFSNFQWATATPSPVELEF